MDLGLTGKVAVVTGAASKHGVGRAIALALAREGADVAVTDIDFEGIQSVALEITAMGRNSIALRVDQGVYDEVKEAVRKIYREMGSVDILINNAALLGNFASTKKLTSAAWEKEIEVNLNGPFYWIREALQFMYENSRGRIINISSIAGVWGGAGAPAYSAAKGGLVALTKSVALEVAKANKEITVNAVSLGIINTDAYRRGYFDAEMMALIKKRIPMDRMGEPNEVANVVAFLASDKASYIQGVNILIDGGILLGLSK